MGYLIDNTSFIKYHIAIIPEADAQVMDVTPYRIFDGITNTYINPLFCTLQVVAGGTDYQGWNNLYLTSNPFGGRLGTMDENTVILGNPYSAAMLINCSHPPTAPGGASKANYSLYLNFQNPISNGTGDIKVILFYTTLPLA